jgi:hypothetical protein
MTKTTRIAISTPAISNSILQIPNGLEPDLKFGVWN